jgi:hypothetical protein
MRFLKNEPGSDIVDGDEVDVRQESGYLRGLVGIT